MEKKRVQRSVQNSDTEKDFGLNVHIILLILFRDVKFVCSNFTSVKSSNINISKKLNIFLLYINYM